MFSPKVKLEQGALLVRGEEGGGGTERNQNEGLKNCRQSENVEIVGT